MKEVEGIEEVEEFSRVGDPGSKNHVGQAVPDVFDLNPSFDLAIVTDSPVSQSRSRNGAVIGCTTGGTN